MRDAFCAGEQGCKGAGVPPLQRSRGDWTVV